MQADTIHTSSDNYKNGQTNASNLNTAVTNQAADFRTRDENGSPTKKIARSAIHIIKLRKYTIKMIYNLIT